MMLNLFIAVIVDAIQHQREANSSAEPEVEHPSTQALMSELQALRSELQELRKQLPPRD